MERRTFLKYFGASPLVVYFPAYGVASNNSVNSLIIVRLTGGNDSLNTFVPYADPAYYSARPKLAIKPDEALPLDGQLGLHPKMIALMNSWNAGDMAVVHGLGYPLPNRSHFRSTDIWQSASDANEVLTQGWLTSAMLNIEGLQAVTIGRGEGTLEGAPHQFTISKVFPIENIEPLSIPSGLAVSETIQHVMDQQYQFNESVGIVTETLKNSTLNTSGFPATDFGDQCKLTAQLLVGGLSLPVFHLNLSDFDTHQSQPDTHANLLEELADGLAALRSALVEANIWSNSTIATYSEFGRRVAENASDGTDHGTAASHLVMGGAVNGGAHGVMPSLSELDDGDLIFSEDFRSYYRSLSDWMGWTASRELQTFNNLGFLN